MQPVVLKQHDRDSKSVRELRTEELSAVNGAISDTPVMSCTGHADGTSSNDDGDEY